MWNAPISKRGDENRILAALSATARQRLLPYLEPIGFTESEILYPPGEKIRYVYFPRNGIVSLLAKGEGIDTIEVAMVGNEGLVGVAVFLGVATPCKSAVVRVDGAAMRMGLRPFNDMRSGMSRCNSCWGATPTHCWPRSHSYPCAIVSTPLKSGLRVGY